MDNFMPNSMKKTVWIISEEELCVTNSFAQGVSKCSVASRTIVFALNEAAWSLPRDTAWAQTSSKGASSSPVFPCGTTLHCKGGLWSPSCETVTTSMISSMNLGTAMHFDQYAGRSVSTRSRSRPCSCQKTHPGLQHCGCRGGIVAHIHRAAAAAIGQPSCGLPFAVLASS